MQIDSLWVKRYGKLRDFQLNFDFPSHSEFGKMKLSIIVGENGTGKTSILRFLSNAFFSRKISSEFSIKYSIGNKQLELTNEKREMLDDKFLLPRKIIISSYSPVEKFIDKQPEDPHQLYANISVMSQRGYHRISSVYIPIIESYLNIDLKRSKAISGLIKEVGYIDPPDIELASPLVNNRNMHALHDANVDIDRLFDELQGFSKMVGYRRKGKARSIILPFSLLNRYQGGPTKWLSDIKTVEAFMQTRVIRGLWFPKGEELISMQEFSSGEHTLFFRFFHLINEIQDESLILIDEPETHLHPRWILKYVYMLNELLQDYRSHVIIATHSPLIISDLPKECVAGLKADRGESGAYMRGNVYQYSVKDATMGGSFNSILENVFGLESMFGNFTQERLKTINSLITNREFEEANVLFDQLANSSQKLSLFVKLKEKMNL